MNNRLTQVRMLDAAKKDFERYRSEGEVEMANTVVREALFLCNKLGLNVIDTFMSITQVAEAMAVDIKDFREAVENNLMQCPEPDCEWTTVLGEMSMRAHIGRKHPKS